MAIEVRVLVCLLFTLSHEFLKGEGGERGGGCVEWEGTRECGERRNTCRKEKVEKRERKGVEGVGGRRGERERRKGGRREGRRQRGREAKGL